MIFTENICKNHRFWGSLRSLQSKKCSKTVFFRIFFIEKDKVRQTPRPDVKKEKVENRKASA